jgi:hypothetical protein
VWRALGGVESPFGRQSVVQGANVVQGAGPAARISPRRGPSYAAAGVGWRQLRLVQAWTELHTDELRADWELAVNEYPMHPIDPLR